jgi:hypothetical protein
MNPTETYPNDRNAVPQDSRIATASPDDPRLAQPLREYLTALEAGHKPNRHEFLAGYPDIAEALGECLDGLEFICTAAPQLHKSALDRPPAASAAAGAIQPEGPLGDFRIVREIGRGGMGVVYEAVEGASVCGSARSEAVAAFQK